MTFSPDLLTRLHAARRVVAFTGAGISAESGIATFRDAQTGLWANFKPEDLATPEAFLRNPRRVWEWYAMRREQAHTVQPNPGHHALVEIERRVPEFTLITQNIDNLHQRAGSQRVIELHGNIMRVKCFHEHEVVERWEETGAVPPKCPRCGSLLRPDVVWFGEMLPPEAIMAADQAACACDFFLSIGTSTVIYPAAALPFAALRAGAMVVEVNPDETPLSSEVPHRLRGKAGEVLPALVKATWG